MWQSHPALTWSLDPMCPASLCHFAFSSQGCDSMSSLAWGRPVTKMLAFVPSLVERMSYASCACCMSLAWTTKFQSMQSDWSKNCDSSWLQTKSFTFSGGPNSCNLGRHRTVCHSSVTTCWWDCLVLFHLLWFAKINLLIKLDYSQRRRIPVSNLCTTPWLITDLGPWIDLDPLNARKEALYMSGKAMQRMNIRIANISYLFLTLPCRRICLPRSWSYSGTKWRNILEQRRHSDSSVTGAVKLLKIVKQCHCQDAAGQCILHMQCNAWDTRELGDPRFPKETTWREILSLDSSLRGKKNKSQTSTTCAILQTEKKWGNSGETVEIRQRKHRVCSLPRRS